jgi:M6 family metalloprotease-like protein
MKRFLAVLLLTSAVFFVPLPATAADDQEIQSLNQNLRDAARRHVSTPGDVLARRAALLRQAIRTNPAGARALLLQPQELVALGGRAAAARGLIEGPATFIADHATVFDSADWRSAYFVYHVSTPEGPVSAYQDEKDGPFPQCGMHMLIEGYQIGDTMLVTTSSLAGQVAEPACSTVGDQHAAVILVSFPHQAISKETVDQYKAVFFGDAPSVNDVYREFSYGKASVSGDVYGPFMLNRDYDSCVDSSTIATLAMAAADAAVDLTPYNRIFILAPPAASCTYGGYSTVGCATYTLAHAGQLRLSQVYQFDAVSSEILRTSPHELGHGLGLGHARTDALNNEPLGPDRTRFAYSEYGDNYSSMGGTGPHHFAAGHKVMLKWFDDGETADVTTDTTADLLPMSSQDHGLKGLHVERRIGSKQYVWIEYRTATGYDASLAPNLIGGALIHFEDPGTGLYTELLDYGSSFNSAELKAGATWSDPYSDLTIQVIEATPDHLRVSIRHDTLCASVSWPSQSSYGPDAFNLPAAISQSACAWNVSGNNFWVQPEAWTSNDGTLTFDGGSNADPLRRQGSVTVARQTFFLSQAPSMQPLSAVYFGPTQTGVTTTNFEVGIALPNSTASAGSVDFLWNTGPVFQGGCAFNYDFAGQTAHLLDDTGAPGTASLATGQTSKSLTNSACTIGSLSDIRTTPFLSNLYFYWLPRSVPGATLNIYYRFRTTPDSAPGDWQQGGTATATQPSTCPVSMNYSMITAGGGGTTNTVTLSAAANCAWQVQSDSPWVVAQPSSGTGSGRFVVTVAANSSASNRDGTLQINQIVFPVKQYSKALSGAPYVSFSQSEVDLGRAASNMTFQFSTSFTDGSLSWNTSSPWLRITSYNIANAGCPCLTVAWDSNLSPAQRQATITATMLDGTPIPGSSLHVVQDPGQLRPDDYQSTTVAGAENAVDGESALATILKYPQGIAADVNDNILVAETDGNRFRRIASDGTISTIAGTGLPSPTPYTGNALQIGSWQPFGVTSDSKGNIYIASNNQVRMVHPDGSVTVIAGSGGYGFSGDGGPASKAQLYFPFGVALAADGTVYFCDTSNQRVRKVTTDGTISTVAGTGTSGYSGDNGPATSARLNSPYGLAIESDGSLLIADRNNHRIRRVAPDGTISTVAGTGTCSFSGDGGPASAAHLCSPSALLVDGAGNVYVADTSNYRVRMISPDGTISTVAGSGSSSSSKETGPATSTAIGSVSSIAMTSNGDLYIADTSVNRIRVVHNGVVSPFAGVGNLTAAGDGGAATSALFYRPEGLTVDPSGNLYISDNATNRVWRVAADGSISTFAGTGQYALGGDGHSAVSAGVPAPNGLAVAADGSVFIAAYCEVRKVDPTGVISIYAGSSSCGFADNASAVKAQFSVLAGMAIDAVGNLYVADPSNQRVRKIGLDGSVTTVAGTGKSGAPVDGGPATSSPLNGPSDVAVDAAGNLYIADRSNYCVRMVTPDGTISTIAGIPTKSGYSGDSGPATHALFGSVSAVKVDANGYIWVADSSYHVVRSIAPDGTIRTVTGTGTLGALAGVGPAWAMQLNGPSGLAIGPNGVYVSDTGNGRVRLLTPPQPVQ